MKKLLSALLTLALMLSLLCVASVTATALEVEGNFEYDFTADETGAILIRYNGTDTDLTIPSTLGGKPVTEITDYSFYDCDTLETVTVPEGVLKIGSYAFSSCNHLTTIALPDSLTIIGSGAFEYSDQLTDISIPAGVTFIDLYAFAGCDAVATVTAASDNPVYKSVGNCLIEKETKTRVLGCKNSVIPTDGSVTAIGPAAFMDCTGLTGIVIPEGVTAISYYAFCRCWSLSSVAFPSTLLCIDDNAFYECHALTDLTLPQSLTEIGEYTFEFCDGLTEISIPAGVTLVDRGAFGGCTAVMSIEVAGGNPRYKSIENCLIDTETGTLVACCKTSIIPTDGSITVIGACVFEGCDTLLGITIPDGVTSIERYAFSSCTTLSDVTVPDSVSKIGGGAFQNTPWYDGQPEGLVYAGKVAYCYKGECPAAVTVADGTIGIAEGAFFGAENLTEITIPESVTYIGDLAFYNCYKLETVRYGGSKRTRRDVEIKDGNDCLQNAAWEYADASGFDPGDANNDGSVDMKDVLVIRKSIAGLPVDSIDLDAADVDGDGSATMKDVLMIRKFIAGLVTSL